LAVLFVSPVHPVLLDFLKKINILKDPLFWFDRFIGGRYTIYAVEDLPNSWCSMAGYNEDGELGRHQENRNDRLRAKYY
jgi:hypothetical protein